MTISKRRRDFWHRQSTMMQHLSRKLGASRIGRTRNQTSSSLYVLYSPCATVAPISYPNHTSQLTTRSTKSAISSIFNNSLIDISKSIALNHQYICTKFLDTPFTATLCLSVNHTSTTPIDSQFKANMPVQKCQEHCPAIDRGPWDPRQWRAHMNRFHSNEYTIWVRPWCWGGSKNWSQLVHHWRENHGLKL